MVEPQTVIPLHHRPQGDMQLRAASPVGRTRRAEIAGVGLMFVVDPMMLLGAIMLPLEAQAWIAVVRYWLIAENTTYSHFVWLRTHSVHMSIQEHLVSPEHEDSHWTGPRGVPKNVPFVSST